MIKNFQKIVYVLAFTFTSWCLSRTLVFFKSEVAPSTYEYRGENMSLTFFLLTNEEEELIKWKQIWPLFPFRPSMGLACQVPETKKCKPSLDKKKKNLLLHGTWENNKPRSYHVPSSSVHPNLLIWHQDLHPEEKTKHTLILIIKED